MKRSGFSLIAAILCCVPAILPAGARAATLQVFPDGSGTYPTIAAAVAAAVSGDIVELAPGVYAGNGNRDINLTAAGITIRSAASDPRETVIACGGTAMLPHRGFTISGTSQAPVVIEGLTITGGFGGGGGPGIPGAGALLVVNGAAPLVRNCVFVNNHCNMVWDNAGGAVYVDYSCEPAFENCEFRGNSAYFGGAVAVNHFSRASFTDCRFLDNQAGRGGAIWGNSTSKTRCLLARNTAEQGGAIWGNGYNEELSVSCTYFGNSAPEGGAIYAQTGYSDPVRLVDTIIAGCSRGEAILARSGVSVFLSCSDLFGNAGGDWIGSFAAQVDANGNFSADPCFCAPAADAFGLCGDSWCLPGRHPWGCDQLVGAYGQTCAACGCAGPIAAERKPLGSVKGMFR